MFKTVALSSLAAFSLSALADIHVSGVQLTASHDLLVEATATGRAVSLSAKSFRDGDPAVTLTDAAVTITAQRFGDQIAIVAVEDGTELGELDLFSPSNGAYTLATPKPIIGRSAGLAIDFQSVMDPSSGGEGWSAAKTLAAIQAYFTANPNKQFSVFRRQLSLGQVTAPVAPTAPTAPPVAGPAVPAPNHPPVAVAPPSPGAKTPPPKVSRRPLPPMPAIPSMPGMPGDDQGDEDDPFFRPMQSARAAPAPQPRRRAREFRGEDISPAPPIEWPGY